MKLVEQWQRVERGLPEDWGAARLALSVEDEARVGRAAALLGPLNPGRRGRGLRFAAARRGAGFGADQLRRLLARVDAEGIGGTLELLSAETLETVPQPSGAALAGAWETLIAALPSDWSDLYCELGLTSTDHLEPAALLLAPVNPSRFGGETGFRFRVARLRGYGTSAEMTRRCLERLDREGIPGRLEILLALSDTRPVATQGPVWRVAGRSV